VRPADHQQVENGIETSKTAISTIAPFFTSGGFVTLDQSLSTHLRQMIDGYQISQAIAVMAELGIADVLARGARSAEDIARETGTEVAALRRLLNTGNGRTPIA
jgi:hypothetical protein